MPLKSVLGNNAQIELCEQDVFMLYSDFGQVLDMPLVACIKCQDGSVADGWVNSRGADTAK